MGRKISPFPGNKSTGKYKRIELDAEQLKWLRKYYTSAHSCEQVAEAMGIAKSILYRICARYNITKNKCQQTFRLSPIQEVCRKKTRLEMVLSSPIEAEDKLITMEPCECMGKRCVNYGTSGCLDTKAKPVKICNALF